MTILDFFSAKVLLERIGILVSTYLKSITMGLRPEAAQLLPLFLVNLCTFGEIYLSESKYSISIISLWVSMVPSSIKNLDILTIVNSGI